MHKQPSLNGFWMFAGKRGGIQKEKGGEHKEERSLEPKNILAPVQRKVCVVMSIYTALYKGDDNKSKKKRFMLHKYREPTMTEISSIASLKKRLDQWPHKGHDSYGCQSYVDTPPKHTMRREGDVWHYIPYPLKNKG